MPEVNPPFLIKRGSSVHVFYCNRSIAEIFKGTEDQAKKRFGFLVEKAYQEWKEYQTNSQLARKDDYLHHFRWERFSMQTVEPEDE